eukprot:scaffold33999_cov50-Attheya_sp.AAC.2
MNLWLSHDVKNNSMIVLRFCGSFPLRDSFVGVPVVGLAGVGEVFEPCAGKDVELVEWYRWQWFAAIVLQVGKFGEISPVDAALVKVFVGTLENHIVKLEFDIGGQAFELVVERFFVSQQDVNPNEGRNFLKPFVRVGRILQKDMIVMGQVFKGILLHILEMLIDRQFIDTFGPNPRFRIIPKNIKELLLNQERSVRIIGIRHQPFVQKPNMHGQHGMSRPKLPPHHGRTMPNSMSDRI